MYWVKVAGKSISAFFKDGCINLAASLSYFFILAIIPLSILVITAIGYFLGQHQDLYLYALAGLINLFPKVTNEITEEFRKVIIFKGISGVTLILYGLLSFELFSSMENSMNIIFKVSKKRPFVLSLLFSFIVVTLVIVFLLASFGVTTVALLFKKYPIEVFGIKMGYKAGVFLRYVAPFILVLLTFTAVFMIIPRIKVPFRSAFIGAVFTTVLWEVAKHFFTWYVKYVIRLGSIYGSLTTFILVLLWLYYSSCIFLLGAEIVNNSRRPAGTERRKR
ncbi:MAG: YihY/virulence factor BrkB family protein [Nitrospirae bacterium]|nr:YihY/virulence factor BrkB family protein [Nitrospirota bacterium]